MRRNHRLVGAVAVVAAAAALPASATAANGDSFQCAPKDAWCIGVLHKAPGNRVFFDFAGFEIRGRYRLCVTPPRRSATCKRFSLRRQDANGAYTSSVPFTRNFPHRVRGRYEVRWFQDGHQVGRTLAFRN